MSVPLRILPLQTMEDTDAPWDVLHDLTFLFATEHSSEDNIEDILDLVDTPVEGKSDEAQLVANRSQTSKKHRVRIDYQRAKLDALRSEVANLKTKLREIKESKMRCSTTAENGIEMSAWEVAARRERTEMIRCQHENEELRAAVDDRAAFIENIKRQVFKKPRLQVCCATLSLRMISNLFRLCPLVCPTKTGSHAGCRSSFRFVFLPSMRLLTENTVVKIRLLY
ncbi:hypothetical protein AC1031_002189 [Aphanomyces cochlioides]|nr:hypothetical protein AC1031_002189 [Aphanomyces cochlioides]